MLELHESLCVGVIGMVAGLLALSGDGESRRFISITFEEFLDLIMFLIWSSPSSVIIWLGL